MQAFGDGLWLADGPCVSVAGFHYSTRMAIMALPDGGLMLWSPVALTHTLWQGVQELGAVRHILAPNHLHHLALAEWATAFPQAKLHAAPRLRKKRPDLSFHADLTTTPHPDWVGTVDQVIFPTLITDEVVLFHRPSGTALFCDLLQQFPADWFRGWRRVAAALDGMTGAQPQVPRKFRLATVKRATARAALAEVGRWQAERVVLAHGRPVGQGGAAFLQRAFCWL
jgi:hypothetical protein